MESIFRKKWFRKLLQRLFLLSPRKYFFWNHTVISFFKYIGHRFSFMQNQHSKWASVIYWTRQSQRNIEKVTDCRKIFISYQFEFDHKFSVCKGFSTNSFPNLKTGLRPIFWISKDQQVFKYYLLILLQQPFYHSYRLVQNKSVFLKQNTKTTIQGINNTN